MKSQSASSGVTPTEIGFKSGEAFDYNRVPQSQMLAVMLDKHGYATSTKVRAVALAKNGLGFVKIVDSGTQNQADTLALEGCFALSGGSPCVILARGNQFALNQKNLDTSYSFQMATTTALSSDQIPFVHPANRAALLTSYQAAMSPKALAIGVDGSYVVASSNMPYTLGSDTEARRLALERCELMTLSAPCTLVAVNSSVVFNPTQINAQPAISYSSAIGSSIPGMRNADFSTYINAYLSNMNQVGYKGSIHITAVGAWGASYSNVTNFDVNNKSQIDCASGVDQTVYPCIKFATDKNIVATPATLLNAIKKQSIDLHCKVIPRFDCAAHASIGCMGPGEFYTTRMGRVQTENCP